MNKKILILILVIVVLGGGFYFYNKKEAKAPTNDQTNTQTQPLTNPSSSTPNTQTNVKGNTGSDYTPQGSSGGGETTGSDIQVAAVVFNGTDFQPSTVNIHVNDWVFFRNQSSISVWPHTDSAPPLGFDPGAPIAPGKEYKHQFTQAGTIIFHNHLNPATTGTIEVSK